jgi:hypothetical protein
MSDFPSTPVSEQSMTRVGFWKRPQTGILAFLASGLVAAFYNLLSLPQFRCDVPVDQQSWHYLEGGITLLASIIPILDRSYDVILHTTGNACRAHMVRELYAADWLICLIGLGFAIPGFVAICRAIEDVMNGRIKISSASEVQRGLGIMLSAVIMGAAAFTLQGWYGVFSINSTLFENGVAITNIDIFRLCYFVPLCLLFQSLSFICLYSKWKYRKTGNSK